MDRAHDLSLTHPGIEPFLVPAKPATCHQGAQQHAVLVLAIRDEAVLYTDRATRQYGIAFQSSARQDHIFAGRQYPSMELAVRMFLGDPAALDDAG